MRFFLATCLSATLTASTLAAGIVAAQEPGAAQETTKVDGAKIKDLVAELASPDFAARQSATKELLALSSDALPELTAALSSASGESEARLRQVVDQLRLRLFDERLAAWIASPDAEPGIELTDAVRYAELIQQDERTRRVFGEVLKSERRLFALRQFAPDELPAELETRSAEFSRQCHGRDDESFPVARALALMLLASDPDVRLLRATSTNISDALDDPRFEQVLEEGAYADIITAVTSAWLKRPGIAVERPLIFCMRHELPAGREIAVRIIEAQSRRQDMAWSLLCLASLKDSSSLPLIESLLESPNQLWPPRGQAVQDLLPDREVDSRYAVQTRDIALAVAIHLRDAKPAEFGFKPEESELSVFTMESLGFGTDEARAAALSQYRQRFPATP